MPNRFDGLTVRDVLKLKKGSVRTAPLPPGSPAWEAILDLTWEEVCRAADAGADGFRTIRKLLSDKRFDR
ncbi:hypothetical protein [Alienimonas sp. DA493]|uniref:hypothetical protein n=1 Tax=Alienimonas sp. DA493 TaxID=3373605 RepID=UPI0037550401